MIQNYCPNLSLKALVLVLTFLLACLSIGSRSVWSLRKLLIRTTSHFFIWHGAQLDLRLFHSILNYVFLQGNPSKVTVRVCSWVILRVSDLVKLFTNSLVMKVNCTTGAAAGPASSNINLVKGIFSTSRRPVNKEGEEAGGGQGGPSDGWNIN